jgi:uncharacterized protein
LEGVADPGSYVGIRRVWREGDAISLRTPMELRQESLPGDESVVAMVKGPLVMAAVLGPGPTDGPRKMIHGRPTEPEGLPPADRLPPVGAAHEVIPLYLVRDERYAVYWQTSRDTGERI